MECNQSKYRNTIIALATIDIHNLSRHKINIRFMPEAVFFASAKIPSFYLSLLQAETVLETPARIIAHLIYTVGFKFLNVVNHIMTEELFSEVCYNLHCHYCIYVRLSSLKDVDYVSPLCIHLLLTAGAVADIEIEDAKMLRDAYRGNINNILYHPMTEDEMCEFVKECNAADFCKMCTIGIITKKAADIFFASHTESVPIQMKPFIEPFGIDVEYYTVENPEDDEIIPQSCLELGFSLISALRMCTTTNYGGKIFSGLVDFSEEQIEVAIYQFFLYLQGIGAAECILNNACILYGLFSEKTINRVICNIINGTAVTLYQDVSEGDDDAVEFTVTPGGQSLPAAFLDIIASLYNFNMNEAIQ